MEGNFHIIRISDGEQTGDLLRGYGPVAYHGKSTFIRRFMEEMVILHMEDGPAKTRSKVTSAKVASSRTLKQRKP